MLALIDQSLQTGSLTLGPQTRAFEEEFGGRHRAPYAVAVSSGTAALEIILRHLDLAGGEVVVPTNTFFASAAAAVHAGGHLKLADVDPVTLTLSVATVEAALTPRTAVVMLVHIGGVITPEADAIRALCDRKGLVLVEDAAHAHGATFDGRSAGSFGYAAAFSFYPTKVVTSGEGGMILTAHAALRDDAIMYHDQGKAGFLGGEHVRMGSAWRMSELHAATGLVHQRRLDEFVQARRQAAAVVDGELSGVEGIEPQAIPSGSASNYYKYVAMLAPGIERDVFKSRLRERHGVTLSGEVYAQPLHRHAVFSHLASEQFPVAEDVCARQVCIPVHSDMTAAEASYVGSSVPRRRLDHAARSRGSDSKDSHRMNVTVTGGSGFIGSHVVDQMMDAGHDVTVVDVRPPHRSDVTYCEVDIVDRAALIEATVGCDAVFHLAGVANVNEAMVDPVRTFEVNVGGTANVWEAARHNGVGRAVLASTVWVYSAAASQGPGAEDTPMSVWNPGHVYTASKLAAEMVATSYAQLYGLSYTILRYGIPYGPRMREELVIPRFLAGELRPVNPS